MPINGFIGITSWKKSKRAGVAFGHPIGHRSFGSLTHADGVAI